MNTSETGRMTQKRQKRVSEAKSNAPECSPARFSEGVRYTDPTQKRDSLARRGKGKASGKPYESTGDFKARLRTLLGGREIDGAPRAPKHCVRETFYPDNGGVEQ